MAKPDSEAREQRILDAAADLFVHFGYDKTTVDDIARTAGVSKGAIYLHFKSKDELFEGLLFREMWRYGEAWLEAVETDPQGGTLGGVYKNVLYALNRSPFMAAIFKQDIRVLGNYLHKPNNIFRSMQATSMRAEFVQAMQAVGAVRQDVDPVIIAHIIEMLAFGLVTITDFKDPAQMPPLEAVFETIALMMDRAFTPEGGSHNEAGKAVIRQITMARASSLIQSGNHTRRQTMIQVNNLVYTYPRANKEALFGLNFRIEAGEIFGFLGPSGAGKSTTQKILIGLLKHYQGSITVLGRELGTWNHDYYEQIGVSFELPNHYLKLTALENLAYFRSLYRGPTHDPMQVLQWVGLADDADKRVAAFSKGMKNRLNVARSLVHQPKLLFLDEPTSGLDPVNARHIKDLILEQRAQGVTVFITTHDMAVADELCDRVAFIAAGKIAVIDAPARLKKQYGQRSVVVEYSNGAPEAQKQTFPLDGLGQNDAFICLLNTATRIETIHSQEMTMEHIFIQVTGQELAA